MKLLVRPYQPKIADDHNGIEGEVVSIELRPPESRDVRRVAVVRAAGNLLRLFVDGHALNVGSRVRVRIRDNCDTLDE